MLAKILFPDKHSIVYLMIFLAVSTLQDFFLDKAIESKSSMDSLVQYAGGPALLKRLIDSWSSTLCFFMLFNAGFFFQELQVGNFKDGRA